MGDGSIREGSFLPFNLSSINPNEATATAIGALPLLQARAPSCPGLEIDDSFLHGSPDRETKLVMERMLRDGALSGDWDLQEDRQGQLSMPDTPGWVNDMAAVLQEITDDMQHEKTSPEVETVSKRPRRELPGGHQPPSVSPHVPVRAAARSHIEEVVEDEGRIEDVELLEDEEVLEDEDALEEADKHVQHAQDAVDAEAVAEFVKLLEKFVERVDIIVDRTGVSLEVATVRATSSSRLLTDLLVTCRVSPNLLTHPDVSPETKARCLTMLLTRVLASQEACNAAMSKISSRSAHTLVSLQAGSMVLMIIAARGKNRALLVEETLDAVFQALRTACISVLFPAVDPDFESTRGNTLSKEKSENVARNRSAQERTLLSEIRQACISLMDEFVVLVSQERGLSSSFLCHLVSLSLICLGLNESSEIQVSAMRCLECITLSHPDHDMDVLDGIVDLISKLPSNRRSLKRYSLVNRELVRIPSAVLGKIANVILSRACSESSGDVSSQAPESRNRLMRLAFRLFETVLAKVFRNREPELRLCLQTLLADLMVMMALPEWPAVELLVQAMSISLVTVLRKGTSSSVFARSLSLDMLGCVAARAFVVHREGEGDDPVSRSLEAPEGLLAISEVDMAGRRSCLLRFLQERDSLKCKDHSIGISQNAQKILFCVDDIDRIQERSKADCAIELANEGRSSVGVDSAVKAGQALLSQAMEMSKNSSQILRKDAVQSARFLARHRAFGRQLPRIVGTILEGLGQPEPTLRAKAVKALGAVVECEPRLFEKLPGLVSSIQSSCMDVSPSVREASLDLLARSVLDNRISGNVLGTSEKDYFFKEIFPFVEQRLRDAAVSVRKRAVLILESALKESTSEMRGSGSSALGRDSARELEIIRLCVPLSGRLDDHEKTVRDLVERTLGNVLFSFECGEPSYKSLPMGERVARLSANRLVSFYCAALGATDKSCIQRNIIPLVLRPVNMRSWKPFLNSVATTMVEILHACESGLAECNHLNQGDGSEPERSNGSLHLEELLLKRLACSTALEALVSVDGSFGSGHCRAFAPYIKRILAAKRRSAADVMFAQRILGIMELAVPFARLGLSAKDLEDVVRDVEKIVCVCPSPPIASSAIRCLCVLVDCSSVDELRKIPADTAEMFYGFLSSSLQQVVSPDASPTPETLRNAKSALPRVGLLARYGQLSPDLVARLFRLLNSVGRRLTSLWMPSDGRSRPLGSWEVAYCNSTEGVLLRLCVIQSLMHVLVRHREFLPKATDILVLCLGQGRTDSSHARGDIECPDHEAQLTILNGIHEILREEELRNVRAAEEIGNDLNNAGPGARDNVVLAAEEDAEAGYLAACAQGLVGELNRTSMSRSSEVRLGTVQCFGLLARQGLVLPATIVPALFGLLVDPAVSCRDKARKVVSFIAERHPAMLASAALEGVHQARHHIMRAEKLDVADVHAKPELLTNKAVDKDTGLSLLSGALNLIPREQRRAILCGLVREFDPRASAEPVEPRMTGANGVSSQLQNDVHNVEVARAEAQSLVLDDELRGHRVSLRLRSSGNLEEMPSLSFFAVTLATLDYAAGAGVGGVLFGGGGTAAADNKLRLAREDVMEVTGVASRILSNSGQIVAEGIKHLDPASFSSLSERQHVVRCVLPLLWLLRVKAFLRKTRWMTSVNQADLEKSEDEQERIRLSRFDLSRTWSSTVESDEPIGEQVGSMLKEFQSLMEADHVDESVSGGRRRSSTGRPRRSAKTPRKRRSDIARGRQAPTRQSSRAKQIVSFDERDGSSDDDDGADGEFVP